MLSIEQIVPETTWRLRRDVLYPGKEIQEMEMDVDRDGYHFGAFTDNKLAGVVSLFKEGANFQFRKLAVDAAFQGRGIGGALLAYAETFATGYGGGYIWCNARTNAIGFYLKSGYHQTGDVFTKNGLDYEIMKKELILI